MKVKVKQTVKFGGRQFKAGEVVDVPNGDVLIAKGLADKAPMTSRKSKED
jgi:hypothetical protein